MAIPFLGQSGRVVGSALGQRGAALVRMGEQRL
jgi:hypothetical protein